MDWTKILAWAKSLPNWGKVLAIIIIVLMLILQLWSCKSVGKVTQMMQGNDTVKMVTIIEGRVQK